MYFNNIRSLIPTGTGSQCYNYKHFFAIVLLAVVDSDYKFIYFDVGSSFGKDFDSTIFKNPTLWPLLINNSLNILEPSVLPNTDETVGDEAFGLSKNVLRPCGGRNLSEKNKEEYSTIDYHVHGGMLNAHSKFCQTNGGFLTGH